MIYLFLVSLLWAFSFGLIKTYLSATDPYLVSFIRISLSLILFIPFLRIQKESRLLNVKLIITGMIQYGLMYITYIYSFRFLEAWQVALFTIYTPIYITLLNDLLTGRFHRTFLITAVLSVAGTAVVLNQKVLDPAYLKGFLILQISNLAFAFGQVYYRRLITAMKGIDQLRIFGLLYFGAFLLTGLTSGLLTEWSAVRLSSTQWFVLLYLGMIASGVGFFLWNYGTTITNTGAYAVLNNLKIPLAVIVTLLFFGGTTDYMKLIIGGCIMLSALLLNQHWQRIVKS